MLNRISLSHSWSCSVPSLFTQMCSATHETYTTHTNEMLSFISHICEDVAFLFFSLSCAVTIAVSIPICRRFSFDFHSRAFFNCVRAECMRFLFASLHFYLSILRFQHSYGVCRSLLFNHIHTNTNGNRHIFRNVQVMQRKKYSSVRETRFKVSEMMIPQAHLYR